MSNAITDCGFEEKSCHVFCDYEAFSALRFKFLGYHLIQPWELSTVAVGLNN